MFTVTRDWIRLCCDAIRSLYLSFNGLTGTIPSSISRLSYLQYVIVPSCSLCICASPLVDPDSHNVHVCFVVRYLDFSYNSLSGSIPLALGSIQSLGYIRLNGNMLRGTLPANLLNISSLQYVLLCC